MAIRESCSVHAGRLRAFVARDPVTIREAQKLRYRIFAEEMGARLRSPVTGLDIDEFDAYSDHLVVVDTQTARVVGSTRLLSDKQARRLGRFYSEGEFTLSGVLALQGRFLEIGRTCVDPNYRGGAVIASLWAALSEYVAQGGFDHLMGCASIPPGPSGFAVDAVYRNIGADRLGPQELDVHPLHPIPEALRCRRDESGIPPLLQAYLRLGAWVCGEPCWDEDFQVMDVFVLLPLTRLAERYERHFIGGERNAPAATGL